MNQHIQSILMKSLDLRHLLKSQPSLFKLNNLSVREKLDLLVYDSKFFGGKFSLKGLNFSQRLEVLGYLRQRNFDVTGMGLDFTNEEFKKLSSRDQFTLFTVDFDRYANVEAYNKLPGYLQSEIYIKNPDWVISSVGQKPRLNQSDLVGIARNNPTFVDKYVVDELENHSTTELFWTHMFKHKPVVYKNLFIKNIHTVSNKSDLRQIFRNSPGLITRLTPEIMDRGKLTIKEWVLLIKNLVDKKHKDLAGWSMSPEMVDALRFDLTVEVMNGTSRSTSHLKSALNSVLKEKQATEIESETVS